MRESLHSEAEFTHKESCPSCPSSDGFARYADGGGHCFVCGHHLWPDEAQGEGTPKQASSKPSADLKQGQVKALAVRKITEETCRHFGYTFWTDPDTGKHFQVAPYFNENNQLAAQKLRDADKKFSWVGAKKGVTLFGQQLWSNAKRNDGRKTRIAITEGEIDAMSVSQVLGNKWPVVSVSDGAQGAKKAISAQLQWLSQFDEVVLMFDMDQPGQDAAKECAALFKPGQVFIANFQDAKDANELLKAGKVKALSDAYWNAKEYRPEGVMTLDDIVEEMLKPVVIGYPWFLPTLTELTFGRRKGEVHTFGAGTGVGKTDFLTQQIEYDISVLKEPVGIFFLEQSPVETGKRLAGKVMGKQFHLPGDWTVEELTEGIKKLKDGGRLYVYNHFGSCDWEQIKGSIRFWHHNYGITLFYVDHLTALADTSNEKESIEALMGEIAGLAQELQIIIHLVSHLSTPDGKGHEEGGHVSIKHFKGSRSIGFWSHFMYGLERDSQSNDDDARQQTLLRVLKARPCGWNVGKTIALSYDKSVGKLFESLSSYSFKDETTS